MQRIGWTGGLALIAVVVLMPAVARAQYQAPPPDPGFSYIFDGSPTGSDASFDKWVFASGTAAQSALQAQATLDTVNGSFLVNGSPFGSYWYPVRPLGDVVIRLQYTVQDTPTSTRNGGVMIRTPDPRYTGENTSAVLAQKPTGYSYELCPGATPFCGRTTPAAPTTYTWLGADGPFPPAPFEYSGAYCARQGTHNVTNLAGTGALSTNGNANNHQHWTQVYCGHEIQINESLNGGGPDPSTDPIKTGSVYGFRNLNAKQSGTYKRLTKGVWHTMEIRTIGQQFTVLIDGEIINQFDNSIPKIASRNGDPPTMARQNPRGYVGLQTHGGNDRISYRQIEVKDFAAADIPVNTVAPTVTGTGFTGKPLTCTRGTWTNNPAGQYWVTWYRANKILPSNPRLRAPSQLDYANFTTPAEPEMGTQPLPWMDSQIIGQGETYTPGADDVGKALYCAVNADNGGATVFMTASAPEILSAVHADTDVSAAVPAQLALTLGPAASFGAFIPGADHEYTATTAANVISTAGDATLSVSDPGHLMNGTFSLPEALRVEIAPSSWSAPVANANSTLTFRQHIGAHDALRTGSDSKTLTFTLSTTNP
jgi:hypothetical protein